MDRIIGLVGPSGSGKSSIATMLKQSGLNYIESYTNRKPRKINEEGHIFVNTDKALLVINSIDKSKDSILAPTFFDDAYYWSTKEQYEGLGDSVYVVDVNGARELKNNMRISSVVIYLQADKETRLSRMLNRQDAFKRLSHDEDKFNAVSCDYVVNANKSLDEVFSEIKKIINQ